MERIIHRQLVYVLDSHKLLDDCQFGFHRKRSTVSLLLQAVHDWAGSLECRNSTHCLFLDLAKAFDSVSHSRLLLKLEALGITDNILMWLKCFLTARCQRVVINGEFSSWIPVISGVPQGSVLGPLLFLLYINDISSVVSNCKVKLFADDVTIYEEITCPADVDLLQLDLSKVVQWAKMWLLRLNPDKCESIVLSNKRSPPVPKYYLDTKLIACKPVIRYLGVFVDRHLNWNDHCKYVAAKATRSLNFLRHCLFNCPCTVKSATYKCIVWPIMEYACPVWFLHTAKNINILERVQLRAARWAAGSRWNPSLYCWSKSSDDCLKELKWPSIHQRHIYFSICQVHDILHNRNSISFSDHFHPSKVHPLNIQPASSTINSYCYSFFIDSPFLWNTIPYYILKITQTSPFRSALRRFLF